MKLKSGKLPPDLLKRLLSKTRSDANVIIGPAYGEDAAAIKIGGKALVAAADPVTFATDRLGYYAVAVNANDVAAHGAIPKYFLATILLPLGAEDYDAEEIFNQVINACESLDILLIGGHTEVTSTVTCPVIAGCMLGEVEPVNLVRSSGARVGDCIILSGSVGIEGTAILARDVPENLAALGVPETVIKSAAALIDDPGICVVRHALIAVKAGGVSAMHDPTEGGLCAALWELASASQLGAQVNRASISVSPETCSICRALSIDPLGLISSGSLLITASPDYANQIVSSLTRESIPAAVIGVMTDAFRGVRFQDGSAVPIYEQDEIARYFNGLSADS